MSSGQNLQSFPHSSTASITHLENGIQFLDRANFVPQSTGIWCLRIYKRGFLLPLTATSSPSPRTTELWIKSLVKPYYFGFLTGKMAKSLKQGLPINDLPHTEEAGELCNLLECLARSQAVLDTNFSSGLVSFT